MHLSRTNQIIGSALVSGVAAATVLAGLIVPIFLFNRHDPQREPQDNIALVLSLTIFALFGAAVGAFISWRRLRQMKSLAVAFVAGFIYLPMILGAQMLFGFRSGDSFTLLELLGMATLLGSIVGVMLIPAGAASHAFTRRTTPKPPEESFTAPPPPPEF